MMFSNLFKKKEPEEKKIEEFKEPMPDEIIQEEFKPEEIPPEEPTEQEIPSEEIPPEEPTEQEIPSEEIPPEEPRLEKKEIEDLERLKPLDITPGVPFETTELPKGVPAPVLKTAQKEIKPPKELIEVAPEEIEVQPEEIEISPEVVTPKEELAPRIEVIKEDVETPYLPKIKARKTEIDFEEIPLREFCTKIKKELKIIKKHIRSLGKLEDIRIDSSEMMDLLDTYMYAKKKLREFIQEMKEMDLDKLSIKKTLAAIYKFRACKLLSKIKEQTLKIEDTCKKAGFIPTKVHEILKLEPEELINTFIRKSKK